MTGEHLKHLKHSKIYFQKHIKLLKQTMPNKVKIIIVIIFIEKIVKIAEILKFYNEISK